MLKKNSHKTNIDVIKAIRGKVEVHDAGHKNYELLAGGLGYSHTGLQGIEKTANLGTTRGLRGLDGDMQLPVLIVQDNEGTAMTYSSLDTVLSWPWIGCCF